MPEPSVNTNDGEPLATNFCSAALGSCSPCCCTLNPDKMVRGGQKKKPGDKPEVVLKTDVKNETGYIKRLDYALTHPGSNVPTQAHGMSPVYDASA